ncbi:hypothetical protein ACNKHW_00630 [Shigella flexneri]
MELTNDAVIKVIGVGGGGGNAVEHMVRVSASKALIFAVVRTHKRFVKQPSDRLFRLVAGSPKAWVRCESSSGP